MIIVMSSLFVLDIFLIYLVWNEILKVPTKFVRGIFLE